MSTTLPTPEEAEQIAATALAFLAEDRERLGRFLDTTGLAPAELAAAAASRDMLGAVLDHLLADESLLLVFAAEAGLEPAAIEPARHALDARAVRRQQPHGASSVGGAGRPGRIPRFKLP